MQYYRLDADADHCVSLGPKDAGLWDFFLERFDSPLPLHDWVPFEVAPVTDHLQDPKYLVRPGDIASFNLTPISLFSDRAVSRMGPILEAYGELLPVTNPNWNYQLYHVTNVLNDALDESKSVIERFSSGKIMQIKKYAFRHEVIRDCEIFRIAAVKWQSFVSQKFVEEVRRSDLTGFVFTPL